MSLHIAFGGNPLTRGQAHDHHGLSRQILRPRTDEALRFGQHGETCRCGRWRTGGLEPASGGRRSPWPRHLNHVGGVFHRSCVRWHSGADQSPHKKLTKRLQIRPFHRHAHPAAPRVLNGYSLALLGTPDGARNQTANCVASHDPTSRKGRNNPRKWPSRPWATAARSIKLHSQST